MSSFSTGQPGMQTVSHPDSQPFEPLAALQKHGYNTHSFLSLYPGVQYYRIPGRSGYVPYVTTHKMVLAAGEPIASEEELPELIQSFLAHFRDRKKYIGFIPVSQKTTFILQKAGFDKVHVGREPIFDLTNLPKPSRSIRQAIRRALRKGLRVVPYDAVYEDAIQRLCDSWQNSHEIPALGFLFQLKPLERREYKRYFLLVDENDHLLALLACSPIYGRNGWYLEDFIRDPSAPNGGSELLIESAMECLSQEGFEMATLAAAPLAGLPDRDQAHPLANKILKLVYRRLSFIYHFQTLEFFKGKFGPSVWEDNAFCFYPHGLTPGLICNLIEAFLPGGVPAIVMHKLQSWVSRESLQKVGQKVSHQMLNFRRKKSANDADQDSEKTA
jgi:phosphatidylglycerol lysyltransferase